MDTQPPPNQPTATKSVGWTIFFLLILIAIALTALALVLRGQPASSSSSRAQAARSPFKETGIGGIVERDLPSDQVVYYVPTELGRRVICYQIYADTVGAMSCDWTLYHHRYGYGDPFDGGR